MGYMGFNEIYNMYAYVGICGFRALVFVLDRSVIPAYVTMFDKSLSDVLCQLESIKHITPAKSASLEI